MRCVRGRCIVCDREIESSCATCSALRPNEHYTEVQIVWSNGSKMHMQVCVGCAPEAVWVADKKAMTQAVWDAWDKKGGTYDRSIVIA